MILVELPKTMSPMSNLMFERDPTTTGTPHLHALTGLRFFAVLLVVLHHFWTPMARLPEGVPGLLAAGLNTLAAHGFIGVSLFFVLSGFVLTYTYGGQGGKLGRRRFWAARFARVYPMYLLALVVASPDLLRDMAVLVHKYGATLGTAWGLVKGCMVMGLVQAWVPGTAMFWNAPAWSLSAEAFFYLLFPLLAGTAFHRGLTIRRAGLALGALWTLVLAMGLCLLGVRLANPGLDLYAVIGMAPVFRLPEFMAGMILGRVFLGVDTTSPALRRAAAVSSVVAMGGFLFLNGALSPPSELAIAFNLPLVVALAGGLACGTGPLAALLSCRWGLRLGEASYGIYLLHVPIGHRLSEILGQPIGTLGWKAFALTLGVTVALSCLLFRYYEDPMRRRIRAALADPATGLRARPPVFGGEP